MKYFDNLGFGMFGWGDEDIGIFGGIRSGSYQTAGQFRCRFSLYDTAHRKATGEDMEIGTMELIVSEPEDEGDPREILELVKLEIDKSLRGMGYGRRSVEALMRAASGDVRISDIKKTKVGFWEAVGLEGFSTRGGSNFGYIRKEPDAAAAMSMA
jgi:GNAT superfamily N-acetyltransferase